MKIAYFVTSLKDVSSVHVVLDLVTSMESHGHSCKVFYFKDIEDLSFPCTVEKITLTSKIAFDQFDVVHTHGILPDLYSFLHKPLHSNTLFVNTIHSILHQDYRNSFGIIKGKFLARMHLLLMKRIDVNVCMSKVAVDYYSRYLFPAKLSYSYNTKVIDKSQLVDKEDEDVLNRFKHQFKYVCGSICIVSDIKGLDQIIQAMSYNTDFGYIIIGDGPAVGNLKEQALHLGVSDRILFLGSKKNAYKFLPYFDVFCMPSHSEGCPVSLLEAAAFSKAIVTTDIPIFLEMFDNQEIVVFAENQVKQCAKAIEEAYLQKTSLGKKAKSKFDKSYTFEHFYNRYLNIYTKKQVKRS